jgi:hypothetical protein
MNMVIHPLRNAMIAILFSAAARLAQNPMPVPYIWKSVQIVGGGCVDGIIFQRKLAPNPGVAHGASTNPGCLGGRGKFSPSAAGLLPDPPA